MSASDTHGPTIGQEEVFALLKQIAGQQNVLVLPRLFIKMTGDTDAALMLAQIVYWSDRTSNPQGWFYKSATEWEEEIGLSYYRVNRAIKTLEPLGVQTVLRKANGAPTMHYRLERVTFLASIFEFLQNGFSRNSKMETEETQESITYPTSYPTTEDVVNPSDSHAQPDEAANGTHSVSPDPQTSQQKTRHQQIMQVYQEALGYPIPNGGEAGKAAKRLITLEATDEEIRACYRHTKARNIWRDQHVKLTVIATDLAAWRQAGSPGLVSDDPPSSSRTPTTPLPPAAPAPAARRKETPEEYAAGMAEWQLRKEESLAARARHEAYRREQYLQTYGIPMPEKPQR